MATINAAVKDRTLKYQADRLNLYDQRTCKFKSQTLIKVIIKLLSPQKYGREGSNTKNDNQGNRTTITTVRGESKVQALQL